MQATTSTTGFECPVCFERFNDSDYAPKSLPCGHSCCLKCAKNLFVGQEEKAADTIDSVAKPGSVSSPRSRSSGAVHTDSITCPICRSVSQTQPTSLPTNYGILNAMPSVSVLLTPPVIVHECSMCKKTKRPVVKHCETCNLFLCEAHTANHQDDHEDHVLKSTVQATLPAMCPKHPKKELEFYCDCKKLICSSCCMSDHKTHNAIDLDDAFDNLKPSIESAISRSKIVCGEMHVMVDELKNLERDLSAKETDAVQSIQTMRQELKDCIDHRCDELISSLPSKRLAVESHRHVIEDQSNQLSSCSQSANVHLDSNDRIYCLSNVDPLIALLSSLDDETKSDDWRQVKYDDHLKLTCGSDSMIQSIEKLGELDASNAVLRSGWVSECRPIIDGVVGEMDQKLNELLSRQSCWVECDRELSSLVDLRFPSCLHQVESISGGDEMMMDESKNELDAMNAKSRTRLRQEWELIVASEFDSAFNRLLTQMKPVRVGSVDDLGSHLSSLVQSMDGSLRVISNKFGSDDGFVRTKMDSTMNQLMLQYGLIKRGFETLLGVSSQMKQELADMCNDMERNLANMKWEDVEARLTSVASNNMNRLTGMRTKLNLSDDWFDTLIRPFQLELDGFVTEKRFELKRTWDKNQSNKPTDPSKAVSSVAKAPSPVNASSELKAVASLVKPIDLAGSSKQVASSEQKSASKLSVELKKPVESAKEEKLSLGMQPCRTELDCRRVIVDILKQTRGVAKWNGPDDEGNRLNWSEELPLGEWDGIAPNVTPAQKRIQIDGNGMITRLWLNLLGMTGMLPDSVGRLTSLTYLGVHNNTLTRLPDSIGNLSSLTYLDVDYNQLTQLPDSIGRLASLAKLYAYSNPITSTQTGKDEVRRRFGRAGLKLVV